MSVNRTSRLIVRYTIVFSISKMITRLKALFGTIVMEKWLLSHSLRMLRGTLSIYHSRLMRIEQLKHSLMYLM